MRIRLNRTSMLGLCSLALLGYGAKYARDCDIEKADKIKETLSQHPYKKYDPYAYSIEIANSTVNEPMFNKTAYWEVEANKIRQTLDKKMERYVELKTPARRVKNVYENAVLNFAESPELKYFLKNQENEKELSLQENINLKHVYSKNIPLNYTFPTLNTVELIEIMKNDTDWIPLKQDGYKIIRNKIKIKKGNGYIVKNKKHKEPIYKPEFKNIKPFFKNKIEESDTGKYLVCEYYAEENI